MPRRQDRRQLVQTAYRLAHPRVALDQVGLGQHDAVGQRDLLARLGVPCDLRLGEQSVDRRRDHLQPQRARHDRIAQDGLRDRRGIGQAGRLDDQPLEARHVARLAPAEQAHHRGLHVARQVAAQTAVRHHHGLVALAVAPGVAPGVAPVVDQVAIERHSAELVHRHRRIGQPGIAQQRIHQRRLPAAQEAAQQRHRQPVPIRLLAEKQPLHAASSEAKRLTSTAPSG